MTSQMNSQPRTATGERRPYAPPRLIVHGDAARLTAGITVGTSDGKSGSGPPT